MDQPLVESKVLLLCGRLHLLNEEGQRILSHKYVMWGLGTSYIWCSGTYIPNLFPLPFSLFSATAEVLKESHM